ncbi:MAG: O-antigen ligase family protein [Verrucomicrobiales bacterium]|nr:O-antigen ligase family protein [Verrucomicrobiales bacterium]
MFFYHTHVRFQGFWDSPNTCAVLLGVALLCSALFFNKKLHWSPKLIAIVSVWYLSNLLAHTYSRGAWVAYGASLIFLLVIIRGYRWPVIWMMLAFAFNLLLLPSGTERVLSSGDFAEGSVHNRLIVYKGATAVISQQPIGGIGWQKFSDYYWTWHQPSKLTAKYPGALNNYLCLAAELGLPVLWLYLLIIWSSIVCSSWLAVRGQSLLAACLAAAQVCFQIAGQFTYTLTLLEIAWVSPLILAVAFGQFLISRAETRRRGAFFKIGLWVSAGALLVCGGIYAAGCFFARQLPARVAFFDDNQAVLVAPNRAPVRAAVVYSMDKGENIQKLGRDTLRYLASHGIAALAVNATDNNANSAAQISRLIEKARVAFPDHTPIFVFGVNSGTRSALAAAGKTDRLAGIILLGSAYEWPEEDESPRKNLAKITCPLYFIHGQYNFLVSYQEGLKLKAEAERLNLPVQWRLLPDYSHYFTASEWQAIMDDLADYVLNAEAP